MLNGNPVVAFQVVRSTGSSLATAGKGVDKAIADLQKTLPADIHITKIRSTLGYVMDSYHATVDSLVIGAILAVIVIWAFPQRLACCGHFCCGYASIDAAYFCSDEIAGLQSKQYVIAWASLGYRYFGR
jgi:hypothetical protein